MDFGVLGRKISETEFLSYHRQPCRQKAHLNVGLARVIEIRGYITSLIFGFFSFDLFCKSKATVVVDASLLDQLHCHDLS